MEIQGFGLTDAAMMTMSALTTTTIMMAVIGRWGFLIIITV